MLSWIAALPIVNATPTMSPKINRIADTPWWLFTTLRRQRVRPDPASLSHAKSSPWRNHKRPRMARRCPIPEDCWIPEMRWKYEIKEDSRRRTFWSEAARTERLQFLRLQRLDRSMSASGQTRPRRPPRRFAYARPVLHSKRTHAGQWDRGSLGPLPHIPSVSAAELNRPRRS